MRKLLILFVTSAGCASAGRLPASFIGEGAGTLAPGHVSLTAAGGGAVTEFGAAGGGGARVRIGIGTDQELGVEVAGAQFTAPAKVCTDVDCTPDESTTQTIVTYSALASWKFGVTPNAAVIASLGASQHKNGGGDPEGDYQGESADGALAFVLSKPLSSTIDLYGGGRLSVGIPIGEMTSDAAAAVGLAGAVGFDTASSGSEHVHFFAEGGGLATADGNHSFPALALQAVIGVRASL